METIPLVHEDYLRRLEQRDAAAEPRLWDLLDAVKDPEIPALSIWDLGVLQDVRHEGDRVAVVITPTYSGCPAMKEIEQDIRAELAVAGYHQVDVELSLSPAWTTDWMSPEGRRRLRDYGIAAPERERDPTCPQCGSDQTERISEFGSTACKALYKCRECLEPFDYFKCI